MLLLGLISVPCSHGAVTEFRVNTYTTSDQTVPAAAIGANGNFVISWESGGQDGDGSGIFMKHYLQHRLSIVNFDGSYHTLWAKSDGTLWAWGANFAGQLGDGTTIDRHSPVRVKNPAHRAGL